MDRVLLLDVQDPHDSFARTVVGVVTMTPQLTAQIFTCAKLARELKEKSSDFQWITFHSSAVDYYEYDDELDPEQSNNLVEQIPVFVKENPFPKSSIERTESDQMRIDEEGVWWATSSKHSGEMAHTMFVRFVDIEKFLAED